MKATLNKLLIIRIVASNCLGFSSTLKILTSLTLLLVLHLILSTGVREKKATSAPEIIPEPNSNETKTKLLKP